MMDWQKLQIVHEKARQATVGYSLHYCEADDSWFFSVSSAAPSEEWVGKNHSFDIAVECVLEWLDWCIGGPTDKVQASAPAGSYQNDKRR